MSVKRPATKEIWHVTHTDTFGGEPNYLRCNRYTIETPIDASQSTIMRRAKAAAGLTGVRGVTTLYADGFEFRPYGRHEVMFVDFFVESE